MEMLEKRVSSGEESVALIRRIKMINYTSVCTRYILQLVSKEETLLSISKRELRNSSRINLKSRHSLNLQF